MKQIVNFQGATATVQNTKVKFLTAAFLAFAAFSVEIISFIDTVVFLITKAKGEF